MIPEHSQLDLFGETAYTEPALLQPVASCAESNDEIRNRSPTIDELVLQNERASSLYNKSRELVKKSKFFNKTQ